VPGATFDLQATIEHRGALVIRTDDGQALSPRSPTRIPRTCDKVTWASRWKRSNPSSSRRPRSRTPTRRGEPPTSPTRSSKGPRASWTPPR
jgi:hypothetical protein